MNPIVFFILPFVFSVLGESWQVTLCNIGLIGSNDTINCDKLKDGFIFEEGSNININLNSTTKTVNIASTGGGGSPNELYCTVGKWFNAYNATTKDFNCETVPAFSDSTTASNVGSGEGIFNSEVGDDLRFNSLIPGQGIDVTNTVNDLTIATDFKIDTLPTLAIDEFIASFNNATGAWLTKIFSINTQSSSNDIFITGINNQTGAITTNQFSVNTQSASVDRQITGINNVTGAITTNQFSVNTINCESGAVNTIDNATGNVTCIAVGGTASESSVAIWPIDRTWANIGATYVNVYTTGLGDVLRIDTTGKSTATLIIDWTKVGTGTQKCIITSTTTPNGDLISFANLVSGLNTNATFDIPTNRENIIDTYKPMCKSTTAGDDPVWLTGQVLLK